mgnify:CR=1 FL=1
MSKEKTNKGNLIIRFIVLILTIISIVISAFTIYQIFRLSSIENLIRYIVMGILFLIDIFILIKGLKCFKNKHSKRTLFIILTLIYSIICGVVGGIIFYLYGQLQNMNTGYVTYSSSLVTMSSNGTKDIKDVNNFKIGIWNNEDSPDGYIIPQEIIKQYKLNDNNEIINYDDYSSMLTDLYVNEIDAMLLPTSYVDMFKAIAGYENIADDTTIIVTKEKEMKKADVSTVETASNGKDVTQPFTILLMGIDSTNEELQKNAIANGDTLIVMTFNPKTLNATMLSIPRDSYVPIACWSNKAENKITHAAGYGTDCMMKTIENYLGVNIDYYAKINFKGLVKLVNAIGGIEMNVTQQLCTDNSSRDDYVCIEPGYQTLDGEHALVYARNRYDLPNGDFGRNQHQQEIVMAIANKFKNISDVGTFMGIINTISNSLDTNLTTKQMLSFYNVGKDIIKKSLSSDEADLINIQQLYLAGNGQMIYDERMRMVLYNYVPNENSRKDIVNAMKQNLELVGVEAIKTFSFSANEPYEKEVIGKGPYRATSLYRLLPDFTGDDMATAKATAARLGIAVNFEGGSGYVVSQNYPANKRIDLMNNGTLKLTLSGGKKDTTTDNKKDDKNDGKKDDKKDDNKSDSKDDNKSDGNDKKDDSKDTPKDDSKDDNKGDSSSKDDGNKDNTTDGNNNKKDDSKQPDE